MLLFLDKIQSWMIGLIWIFIVVASFVEMTDDD